MSDTPEIPRPPRRRYKAMVAAARPLRIEPGKPIEKALARRELWHEEAWGYYDEIPEVKFAALFLGDGMSKVDFYAAVQLADGSRVPIESEKSPLRDKPIAAIAVQEMARLKSERGGQSEINRATTINWTMVGDCWLHGIEARAAEGIQGEPGYKAAEPERWEVRSVSEVTVSDKKDADGRPVITIKDGSPEDKGDGRQFDPENETLIRMWLRHARWADRSDCHFRACLGDCETLTLLTNQQKAEAKSRLAPGLLLVPDELDFAEDDETDEGAADDQPAKQSPFVSMLTKALTTPIEDPASESALVPLTITGPAEFLTPDRFRLLSFARTADSALDARISALIHRLARGANVPLEVVLGHMNTTYANAEQIDQDTFDDHFEPTCDALANAYLSGFLRPQLYANPAGFDEGDVEQVIVWYDAGRLVRGQSIEESADELFDRGLISREAYLRIKGGDVGDMPDEIERIRQLAERKGIFTSDLTTTLLKKANVLTDDDVSIEGGEIVEGDVAAPTEDEVEEAEQVITAAFVAGEITESVFSSMQPILAAAKAKAQAKNPGRKLADIDRDLRTRLVGAAETAMARALERAGNRLKAKAGPIRASLSNRPVYTAAATLGPTIVADAGFTNESLLADAWDELEAQFKLWSRSAGESAIEVLAAFMPNLTETEQLSFLRRQAASIDDAWAWLRTELDDVGGRVLYSPERGALLDALGEADLTARVPVGILREAMARAGGATGLGGVAGIVTPSNKTPVGGIATGEDVMALMRDEGVGTPAFRWIYGPARRRPFDPHAALDGVVFDNFDDDMLSNTEGWPETPYFYPGDHDGCACDFEPIIVPPNPGEIGGVRTSPRITSQETS